MSDLQPTPIVDKNGKRTTVNKRTSPKLPSRLGSLKAPTKGARKERQFPTFTDDPNGTYPEVDRKIRGHLLNLQDLIDASGDKGEAARLSQVKNGVEIGLIAWDEISGNSETLGQTKEEVTRFLSQLEERADKDSSVDDGYRLVKNALRALEPVAPGEDYTPRLGRTDMSPEDKLKIASLVDVGGIAQRTMNISLSTSDKPVKFTGGGLVRAMDWIQSYRQGRADDDTLNKLVNEFLHKKGDHQTPKFQNSTITVPASDLRLFLIEMAVIDLNPVKKEKMSSYDRKTNYNANY